MSLRVRGAILLLLASCARSGDVWRAQLSNPDTDAFDRGLAAIALGAGESAGLEGVPTALLSVLDDPQTSLAPAARSVLQDLPPSALPEMCRCLVDGMSAGDPTQRALDLAIARHGAAAIRPLLDTMPDPSTKGAQRVGRIVIAIGKPAIDTLAAELHPGERGVRAAFLLGAIGRHAPGSLDALLAAARSEDRRLAAAAIDSLPRVNPAGWRVEPALRELSRSADAEVAAAADLGLGRILVERSKTVDPASKKGRALLRDALALGDGATVAFTEGLWPRLSKNARFSSEAILGTALRWSLEIRPRTPSIDAIRAAEKRLDGGQLRDRRSAALEIGRMGKGGVSSVPALGRALENGDWGLRFCAGVALALIAVDLGKVP